jgi:hypothetical protein
MDPDTFTDAINFAKSTAQAVSSVTDVYKKIRDAIKEGENPKNTSELDALVGELMEKLFVVQENNLAVQARLQELQQTADREQEFKARLRQYEPHITARGGSILRAKEGIDPPIWPEVCAICAEVDRYFMPLQKGADAFVCKRCDGTFWK